jgi:hypothetical protein
MARGRVGKKNGTLRKSEMSKYLNFKGLKSAKIGAGRVKGGEVSKCY